MFSHRQNVMRVMAVVMALALVPMTADAQTKVKSGFNMFSPEQDVEIGRQSAAEVERQLPIVTDRAANDLVNDIARRLVPHAGGPKFPYQFRVVDASDINAFALPGGPIYLNRGIIENAKTEGEVAGVIAHEIAHVALRHGTHNASKAYLTQAGIGILGGLLGGSVGANTAQIINVLGGFGLNALFLKYSREAEKDADILGVQMLAKAGYSPGDMVSFFQTLAKSDKKKTVSWLSSHPAPENRIARIQKEAQSLRVGTAPTTSVARLNDAKASLRRLPPARTTEQIAQMRQPTNTRGGTTSSGRMRGIRVEPPSPQARTYTSRSRTFSVAVPANWEVVQEGSNAATLSPRGGAGELNGSVEVAYGVIVSHYEPFMNEPRSSRFRGNNGSSTSIEEATNDLVSQLLQSAPHLRVVRGSESRLRVAGGSGLGAVLRGRSPATGLDERVTVVTRMLGDGHLVYMLFITPESEARAYSPVLENMIASLRVTEHGH